MDNPFLEKAMIKPLMRFSLLHNKGVKQNLKIRRQKLLLIFTAVLPPGIWNKLINEKNYDFENRNKKTKNQQISIIS